MGKILASEIQRWVTTATENGLSAASVRKYHSMLHSVFERAQRDRVVTFNPCAHIELPKVIKKKARTLTRTRGHAAGAVSHDQPDTDPTRACSWRNLVGLKCATRQPIPRLSPPQVVEPIATSADG